MVLGPGHTPVGTERPAVALGVPDREVPRAVIGVVQAGEDLRAAAQRGEPWQSFFAPDEMAYLLAKNGFEGAGSIRQRDTVPKGMWQRADSLRPIELSMIVRARLRG